MNYEKIARQLIAFFKANPGVGHTRSLLKGSGATRAHLVLAQPEQTEQAIRGIRSYQVLSLADVEEGALEVAGRQGFPLVLDNEALVTLLEGLTDRPEKTAKKVRKSEKTD